MMTCQFTEILGGAELQCARLTEELRRQVSDIVVLTSRVPGFDASGDEHGTVRFWTYKAPQLAGRYLPASLLWAAKALYWIARHRGEISILHCHQLRINAYVAAMANWLWGIPTVMKPGVGGKRNDFKVIGSHKYVFGRRGARFVANHSSAVVAISSEIAENCIQMGIPQDRIHRIGNGATPEILHAVDKGEQAARVSSYLTECRLIYAGRLSPEKNVGLLAEALSTIYTSRPGRMTFAGEGPLRASIEEVAKKTKSIEIEAPGRVGDIAERLRRCHFSLVVSQDEGLSNFLIEAAVCGTVPIVSLASGNRDVVPFADYPLVVEEPTVSSLARAIQSAFAMELDDWQEWSLRVSEYARAEFDLTSVAEKYLRLYDQLRQVPMHSDDER
ncbi:glycosyltransferase family 4 protein [Ovoidimarina sediminis]|uniref:glycosyltransferase family 4 protein n=1 Tax=Ovoidimarina sediminis TaxID=3079856 RepID=UPI002914247E|nr:glycosyltransferase family 4 protein [Rhodophyticola sp. MJ-SS7]MDU8945536.1 glycosyltransferase family 4 protein [Rhodophyticola sp. MJ-SS7]